MIHTQISNSAPKRNLFVCNAAYTGRLHKKAILPTLVSDAFYITTIHNLSP